MKFPCFISDVLNLYKGLNRKPSQHSLLQKHAQTD